MTTATSSSSESTLQETRRPYRLNFGGRLLARRAGEPEAILLFLICALDMYSTLVWVVTGEARESNTNLAWTFHHHPVLFVLIKCASCIPALLLMPKLAQKRPQFTVWLLRAIIFFYLSYYALNIKI